MEIMCIRNLYICGYMSVWACLQVDVHACGGQRLMLGVLSITPFYLLRQRLLPNIAFTDSASLTAQLAQKNPVSAFQVFGLQWQPPQPPAFFYVGTGDPDLIPHTCMATVLPSEPSSQSRNSSFLSN